jgi:hypothetical protein
VPDAAATLQSVLQSAIAALRQSAVVKQDGMATLMANVMRAVTSGTLPPAVQSAVQQLVDLHLPANKAPTADDIKSALANSGLFTAAALAKGSVPTDLTAGLGKLSQAAQDWATKLASSKADLPHQGPSVPPPGGAPVAQATAAATLPLGANAALTAKLLASGSEAALARQDLLQLASLPDAQSPTDKRWMIDVPLMTPQGPAVAQLVVTRDGSGTSPEAPEPVWRVGLAVNIEPLGPVRANLALSGGHAWVTIAAERPDSLNELQKNAGWLSGALQDAELEADLAFQSTAPVKTKLGGYGSGT